MSAIVNVKVDPKIKAQAQALAQQLGLSLSALINSYLCQFVRTKSVYLSLDETPSPYLVEAIRESEQNLQEGKFHKFTDIKKAQEFLKKL